MLVFQHLKMGFIVLTCKWSINLPLPGPLPPVVTFNMYAKAHANLLGTWQYHLSKGEKKSILFKMPSSWLFALGRWQSFLDSRSALVFSLWFISIATAVYQTVVMPAILDGIYVCTDAVFENRMVMPTLGFRHGWIKDPGLHPLNSHPCCNSLGKVLVSAELGRWAAQMVLIPGGDLSCLCKRTAKIQFEGHAEMIP